MSYVRVKGLAERIEQKEHAEIQLFESVLKLFRVSDDPSNDITVEVMDELRGMIESLMDGKHHCGYGIERDFEKAVLDVKKRRDHAAMCGVTRDLNEWFEMQGEQNEAVND